MFNFQAVADMEKTLGEYAEHQQGWSKLPERSIGRKGKENANRRMRYAAKARRSLRAFLRACEEAELIHIPE